MKNCWKIFRNENFRAFLRKPCRGYIRKWKFQQKTNWDNFFISNQNFSNLGWSLKWIWKNILKSLRNEKIMMLFRKPWRRNPDSSSSVPWIHPELLWAGFCSWGSFLKRTMLPTWGSQLAENPELWCLFCFPFWKRMTAP